MSNEASSMLMSLVPWLLVSIPFVIGNYMIAERLGRSRLLWLFLSIIPFANMFFNIYVFYVVIITGFDMLSSILSRLPPVPKLSTPPSLTNISQPSA
jgi:hypothetical protein